MTEALKLGALSANISSQEPIDVVMHESCEENATLWDNYTQSKFVPFNPTDKYTIATIVPKDGSPPFRLMKGAPQVRPPNVSTVMSCLVGRKPASSVEMCHCAGGPQERP